MKTIYLTNGELNDTKGAGVTVKSYQLAEDGTVIGQNATLDGKPYFGYLPKEVTKEEYDLWVQRIANPDNKEYFPSMFAGRGVINKAAREALDKQIATAKDKHCKEQCEANQINFKLAQRDAEAIGEDHEAVFTSKHPTVSEAVKAMLFAEARKAKQ